MKNQTEVNMEIVTGQLIRNLKLKYAKREIGRAEFPMSQKAVALHSVGVISHGEASAVIRKEVLG